MVSIYQGETLTFTLSGDPEEFNGYEVRAVLHPASNWLRRDCSCGEPILTWVDKDMDTKEPGKVVWTLTTAQSASLPVGKYDIEVALRDIETQQDIKDSTKNCIIEVKQSYTTR